MGNKCNPLQMICSGSLNILRTQVKCQQYSANSGFGNKLQPIISSRESYYAKEWVGRTLQNNSFIKIICHPSCSSGDSEQLTLRIIMIHTQFIRTEETVLVFRLMPLQVAVICII